MDPSNIIKNRDGKVPISDGTLRKLMVYIEYDTIANTTIKSPTLKSRSARIFISARTIINMTPAIAEAIPAYWIFFKQQT